MREIQIQTNSNRSSIEQIGGHLQSIKCKTEQKRFAELVRKGRLETINQQSAIAPSIERNPFEPPSDPDRLL